MKLVFWWHHYKIISVIIRLSSQKKQSRSSVGRAQPCQGWGREFEPRLPLSQERLGDCDSEAFSF